MKRAVLEQILAWRAEKAAFALVTRIADGQQVLIRDGNAAGDLSLDAEQLAAVAEAVRQDRSGPLGADDPDRLFIHAFNPPLRMIVVGAVHITQPLAAMAERTGMEVTVIDPRRAFATAARFPGIDLRHDWPDEAMSALAPDARTAVVTLTHDPKLDDPALHVALRSDAYYIGCLGSRRTHAKRLERLAGAGFGPNDMARLHGPAGLSLGAKSPAEIAVSILAEAIQVHRQGASISRAAGKAA